MHDEKGGGGREDLMAGKTIPVRGLTATAAEEEEGDDVVGEEVVGSSFGFLFWS